MTTIQRILDHHGALALPGLFDALSARIAQRAGCPLGFVSGYSVAAPALAPLPTSAGDAQRRLPHARWVQMATAATAATAPPRLRPCAGEFKPLTNFDDRALVQVICALRLFLPDAGIVLSTREPAGLRDRLIPLGVTMMRAGSHTAPGGYTGAGQDNLHYTKRGRIQEFAEDASEWAATGQFDIADEREPSTVAATVTRLGYEPVWKDWDAAILTN